MEAVFRFLFILCLPMVLLACASTDPPRHLDRYLPQPLDASLQSTLPERSQIRAGLVLISVERTPAMNEAIPEPTRIDLANRLAEDISRSTPIKIVKLFEMDGSGDASPSGLVEFGRGQGLDHLVVMLASSVEREYPISIFLGWASHKQPGWRRDHWVRLEAALIDLRAEQTLLMTESLGWATLDRPTAPGISQWYPVIYLRPQYPERRIFPPNYEAAPTTLRVVAFREAAKRLTTALYRAWNDRREQEIEHAQARTPA